MRFLTNKKSVKLWVDDIRDAPDDSWAVCRKPEEAIRFIARYMTDIQEISLDHDIENRPSDETFKVVAYFLGAMYHGQHMEAHVRYAEDRTAASTPDDFMWYPVVTIHSANPTGAKEIAAILEKDYGLPTMVESVIAKTFTNRTNKKLPEGS